MPATTTATTTTTTTTRRPTTTRTRTRTVPVAKITVTQPATADRLVVENGAGLACVDLYNYCFVYAMRGQCSSVNAICCKSCNQVKATTTAAPTVSKCADRRSDCAFMAKIGVCLSSREWMITNCCETCSESGWSSASVISFARSEVTLRHRAVVFYSAERASRVRLGAF